MAKDWIRTDDEIRRFRECGRRLASVLAQVMDAARPGTTTFEIDMLAEKLIRSMGGIPVFKGYGAGSGKPFPGTLCPSINNEVVHAIPRKDRIIHDGDILKLDIGMRFEGMVTDMARTVAIGKISKEAERLLEVTRESLSRGIAELRPGARISDYSRAVQDYVEENGFSVVRDLVGHGVGRELHEEPHVPNFVSNKKGDIVIQKGMMLALEPMVNAGRFAVEVAPDQWTIVTADGSLSAHFEDSVVVMEKGAEVVTRME